MKYDVVIAHRVCPAFSATAVGFDSKFDLVKASAGTLFEALRGLRAKLIVILDGCPEEYERIFAAWEGDVEIIKTDSIGNRATYQKQIEVLCNVEDSDAVYFSEDDYLYRKGAFRAMLDFLNSPGVDFVTPLDHPDRYLSVLDETRLTEVRISTSSHWRQVGTTCLTFMTMRDTLHAARRQLELYSRGVTDITMWLCLTKDKVYNLFHLVKIAYCYILRIDIGNKVFPLVVWKASGGRVAFWRRYSLWSPIPTLAVHLSSASLPLKSEDFFPVEKRDGVRMEVLSYMKKNV